MERSKTADKISSIVRNSTKEFQKNIAENLSNMKVGKIPDFGGQQSFDEIMQLSQLYYIDEDGNQQKKKRPSLWMLFYDCM
jgi:hypothetical protein